MFTPNSPNHSSSRRAKPYNRKVSGMTRSGSILGTIKNIVVAPLSWFSSNENFEDLGKRRRVDAHDASGDEKERQTVKRMRVDSPERGQVGYLDPPVTRLQPIRAGSRPRATEAPRRRQENGDYNRELSAFGAQPLVRTMSVDPPVQYVTLQRDHTIVPLPLDSPLESGHSMSLGPRDYSMQPPTSPFRLRTSLTPQPSPTRPVRREVSAPPPLSSLMSRPIFVKPPPQEQSGRQLSEQKTMSLGSFAEFNRMSRSLSRDRMLTSFGSIASIPSQLSTSTSSNAPLQSTAEKAFRDLEMYKTPIIPSRYKDAKVIPDFLKPKRVHVPIPMTKKGREVKPSLGMGGTSKSRSGNKVREKDDGKPYAGRGGLSKLLARRKAEEEEQHSKFRLEEEDENEEVGKKKDVGVSAKPTPGSEDERAKKKAEELDLLSGLDDPFARPPPTAHGRHQPYGRVGRTPVRESKTRSAPLGRAVLKTNKFSADFDEDDSMDDRSMMDEDGAKISKEAEVKKPVFDAPANFTFANTEANTVEHNHSGEKEPPIPSLPFSFGKPQATGGAPEPFLSTVGPISSSSINVRPSSKSPESVTLAAVSGAAEQEKAVLDPPKFAVVPPTPEQSSAARLEKPSTSNFFTGQPTANDAPPAINTPSIPNFFAKSAFLAASKPVTVPVAPAFPTVSSGPSMPVKDVENPLWNGDARPASAAGSELSGSSNVSGSVEAPGIQRPRSAEPKPLPFGGLNKPNLWGAPKPTESGQIPSFFGNTPKQTELPTNIPTETQPGSTPLFGSGGSTASVGFTPNPGVSSSSISPAQPAATPFFAPTPQPSVAKAEAEKNASAPSPSPSPFFAFGASPPNPTPSGTGADVNKALFGTDSTSAPSFSKVSNETGKDASKSPFTFGAPPMAAVLSGGSTSATESNLPKPVFGATSGSGFSFGASTAAPSTASAASESAKSPFAFGAPPATPPSGAERKDSFSGFGAVAPSNNGFSFNTPTKATEAAAPPTASAFSFGAPPARPVTPPSKTDEREMRMEESPTRDDNGSVTKPVGGMTFGSGPTPVNPFGQTAGNTSSVFGFGAPAATTNSATPNPFAPKPDNATSGGFSFGRVASAPAISTTFSFGQKSEESTTPTTAFGAQTNPFSQSTATSPFSFGPSATASTTVSNPFASSGQTAANSTPSSPFQQAPSFSFGTPSNAPSNPFNFGTSQPSSPAGSATGLPQSPATTNAPFAFGQPNGSSGSTLFNIGAPPPSAAGGTPGRPLKKLPRRGTPARR